MPLKQLVMMLLKQLPMLLVLGLSLPNTHTHAQRGGRAQTSAPARATTQRAREQKSKRTKEPKRDRGSACTHTHRDTLCRRDRVGGRVVTRSQKRDGEEESKRKSERGGGERQRNRSLAQEKHSQEKHSTPRGPDRE